jgi:hypothetical protein
MRKLIQRNSILRKDPATLPTHQCAILSFLVHDRRLMDKDIISCRSIVTSGCNETIPIAVRKPLDVSFDFFRHGEASISVLQQLALMNCECTNNGRQLDQSFSDQTDRHRAVSYDQNSTTIVLWDHVI